MDSESAFREHVADLLSVRKVSFRDKQDAWNTPSSLGK
jgi:hypothetical protein